MVDCMYGFLLKYNRELKHHISECRWQGKLSATSIADAGQMMDGATWSRRWDHMENVVQEGAGSSSAYQMALAVH
jgi:hypothetical protein